MEKRPEKTLARTLDCLRVFAKTILVIALFIPPFALMGGLPLQLNRGSAASAFNFARVEGRTAKDLVKIYTIVRWHRPDIDESEGWRLADVILHESAKRHVDPLLVLALIRVESGFRFDAVSPMGARGMMQIMPDTGRSLAETLAGEYGFQTAGFTPESLHDPVLNLRLGIYYLHDLKKQFNKLTHALTAYNFGPAHTQSRLENNLELSENYAAQVLAAYRKYQKATRAF